jgi:hypothetical protein
MYISLRESLIKQGIYAMLSYAAVTEVKVINQKIQFTYHVHSCLNTINHVHVCMNSVVMVSLFLFTCDTPRKYFTK